MLGNKSDFFKQSELSLRLKRSDVLTLLLIKGYGTDRANIYLNAYDYFCTDTSSFDGASFSKDLCDIPDLDLDAMLHDYHYLVYNAGASFSSKWLADWLYAKGNERKGKGQYSSFTRFIGLTIFGLIVVPFYFIKKGMISNKQRISLNNDYKLLVSSFRHTTIN